MTCYFGDGIILCTGRSGPWRVDHVLCPWCCVRGDEPVRALSVLVYSGYGGSDYICGACGQAWSDDGDCYLHKMTEDKRDENVAMVAAQPDPACFVCHDTGDKGMPLDEEPMPCDCPASRHRSAAGEGEK